MLTLRKIVIFGALFLLINSCTHSSDKEIQVSDEAKVNNLVAFAKLYGYIRYFHPSDEASSIDWDRFMYYGVNKVLLAKDSFELKNTLESLFYPIAPTLTIFFENDKVPIYHPQIMTDELSRVTWQHKGVGFTDNKTYASVRLGRIDSTKNGSHGIAQYLQNHEGLEPGALFKNQAQCDELIIKNLGVGLKCQFPIALNLVSAKPAKFSNSFNELKTNLDRIELEKNSAQKNTTRICAVITSWNIFQHFYPYFDVIDTNWNEVLIETLNNVLDDQDEKDCLFTLRQMIAALEDGHATVFHSIETSQYWLPLKFDYVENQIVVVASNDPRIQKGDVLIELDSKPAIEVLLERERIESGSSQWKRYRGLLNFTLKEHSIKSTLTILRRNDTINLTIGRDSAIPNLARPENIEKFNSGIYYVNLDQASLEEIENEIQQLAAAKGVIFDLRGYPNSNHEVISYMIDHPVRSAHWNIPQIIYPDHEKMVGYDTSGRWTIEPKQPRIKGKVVFLTDESAVSYSESIMGIIEHYQLAEIVGSRTAGANGNINPFTTIGGFQFSWTGMKVLKHDGRQHHLVGIAPTVPVEPTINGIIEGRDEQLEKAIEILLEN